MSIWSEETKYGLVIQWDITQHYKEKAHIMLHLSPFPAWLHVKEPLAPAPTIDPSPLWWTEIMIQNESFLR